MLSLTSFSGLYVWYMDDSDVVKCVRLPRAYHGVLYSGCGYVILRVGLLISLFSGISQEAYLLYGSNFVLQTIGKEDSMRHQLWAWMGEDGSTVCFFIHNLCL